MDAWRHALSVWFAATDTSTLAGKKAGFRVRRVNTAGVTAFTPVFSRSYPPAAVRQILYTGDFSNEEDRHLVQAEAPSGVKVDILITVS